MKYTRVRRAVSAVMIDSYDEDRNPELVKVNGTVTFTPLLKDGDVVQWAGPNGPQSLVLAPIECFISNGIIMHRGGEGIFLAAGGPGVQPDVIQWKATFKNMQAGGWAFNLKPVMFDAVPDGEVDLTLVSPIAGASEPIVRGPAGVGLKSITVDGSELVVTVTSEAGTYVMSRIPLEDVVRAEADQAVASAQAAIKADVDAAASSATKAKSSQDAAAGSASAASASASAAQASASTATTQAKAASTSAANAKTSETNAKTSENNSKSSETNAGKSATTATNEANRAQSAQQAAEQARTDTQNALSTKADKVHTHTTKQVTGLDTALAGKAAQVDVVALQQKLAALTAPVTVFQGSHKMSSGTLVVNTPRLYGTVTITISQSGPDNQAGLVQPRIFDHTGTRYTESMGGWEKTGGGAGTAYRYLSAMASGQAITLDPGYYIDGIEIYSWQTGANTVTKIYVQN